MKRLLIFLFGVMFWGIAQAQLPVLHLKGTVLDLHSGLPAINQTVYLYTDSSTQFHYFNTVQTDSLGQYADAVQLTNITSGAVIATTYDCLTHQSYSDTFNFSSPNTLVSNALFQLNACSINGCSAFFNSFSQFNDVFFSHLISSSTETYTWDFGDGTTGTGALPTHSYTSVGNYNVCLYVFDTLTYCADTFCTTVSITQMNPCSAVFNYTIQNGNTVQFNYQGPAAPSSFFHWSFGDGGFSTNMSPLYTYTSGGAFTVSLSVFDSSLQCYSSYAMNINLPNCNAQFTYAASFNTVQFDAANNVPGVTYLWSFGDGTSATGASVSHTYPNTNATYQVCLTVVDSLNNCTGNYCAHLQIQTVSGSCHPYMYFWPDPNVPTNRTILFSDASSVAWGDSVVAWSWSFGDSTYSTLKNPTHTYASYGSYNICLTITTAAGCINTFCLPIHVVSNNNSCAANFNYTSTNNVSFNFNDISMLAAGDSVVSWNWSFGDGGSSTQQNPTYTYSHPSVYHVCLTIITSSGCSSSFCAAVGQQIGGCQANFIATPDSMNSVFFSNLTIVGGGIYHYAWDFGDGNTSTTRNAWHTYAQPGVYNVCLTVSSPNFSCFDTYCMPVSVGMVNNVSILGKVYSTVSPGDSVMVSAYTLDSINQTMNLVATTYTFSDPMGAFYYFNGLNPGVYIVLAEGAPGTSLATSVFPTYGNSTLAWFMANQLYVDNLNSSYQDIYLIPASLNLVAPGVIRGNIVKDASFAGHTANRLIDLVDANDNPVRPTWSDAQGNFEFANLMYGTYKLWVEIPGMNCQVLTVNLNPGTPLSDRNSFILSRQSITLSVRDQNNTLKLTKTYPNPVVDIANVELQLTEPQQVQFTVTDLVGKVVFTKATNTVQGGSVEQLNLSNLPSGAYMLTIQTPKGSTNVKLLKQ